MRRIFSLIIVLSSIFGLTLTAYATLWDRGGGLIYATDLNITWYDPISTPMTWGQAMTWAENLTVGGVKGWRLLQTLPVNGVGYN
jgi:hypothetical protein